MKNILKNKLILVISCILVIGGLVTAFLLLNKKPDVHKVTQVVNNFEGMDFTKIKKVKIDAVSSDKAGVDPDSAFLLKCELPVTEREISTSLFINSGKEYKLKKVSDREYFISLNSSMSPNKVYKFTMNGLNPNEEYSWAFQTKKPFKVLRSLPRDKATEVPADTGIEITLSYDNAADFESHFKIEPAVPGRFEKHKRTIVFIPENGLEYAKIYKVTISKGIKMDGSSIVTDNDYSFEFQTKMSPPGDEDEYTYLSICGNDSFNTSTKPVFFANASENIFENDLSVKVYKIPDVDSYIKSKGTANDKEEDWAKLQDMNVDKDVSGFSEVLSYNGRVMQPEDFYYGGILELPQPLKEGYYLMRINASNETRWAYFQVNDIMSYINVSENKLLFWVNDASTKKPVDGAVIESKILPDLLKTDASGIAFLDRNSSYSESSNLEFRISATGHETLLNEVSFYSDSEENKIKQKKSLSYLKYLYLDRNVYLPDDKVKFFGVIKPRAINGTIEKVRLTLTHSTYYWEDSEDKPEELDAVEVQVSKEGTFSGELKVSDVDDGYLNVNLLVDGVEICSEEASIGKYEKPSYTLSLTESKERIFAWEPVSFEATAAFYEGAPANNMKLKYEIYAPEYDELFSQGEMTSDINGKIKVDTSFEKIVTGSCRPYWADIKVSNALAEEQDIRASSDIMVFPSDTLISIDTKTNGQACTVNVETNKIVLDKPDNSSVSDYKGDFTDGKFKATIKEFHNIKIDDGEEYDIINKQTIKKYKYERTESVINEFDFATTNGKYQFDFPCIIDEETNQGYKIIISGQDSRGTPINEEGRIYPYSEVSNDNEGTGMAVPYFYLVRTKSVEYAGVIPGEQIDYSVKSDDKELTASPDARFLFMLRRGGVVEYIVTDKPQYSFTFKEDYIPDVFVKAIYFDGSFLYDLEEDEVRYDTKQRELKIEAVLDKETYKPGDTVNATFKVTDMNNNPVGMDINVSVVEEALVEEYGYEGNVLDGLYGFTDPDGVYFDFCSLTYPDYYYPHGGHGGDYREQPVIDHNETAFFKTITLDNSGIGNISFALPDTLTKWRLSFQGFNNQILGGQGKIDFTTRVPFFADVLCGDTYLSGDNADILLRSFGTEMQTGENIRYKVALENPLGEKRNETVAGKTGEYAYFTTGELMKGTYKVNVTAFYKDYQYSLQKEMQVSDNILIASRVDYKILADGLTLDNSSDSKTSLVFYNNSGSMFYSELNSLSCSWGERIDQKLSRITANELLKKYFNEDSDNEDDENVLLNYQQSQGGISLLTYDDIDPELTAKVCSSAADRFDKVKLAQYFYGIIENEDSMPEAVASAYWGLASIGESVLLNVQSLMDADGFTGKSKLYLALALAELGDFNTAQGYLNRLVSEKGKRMDPLMYIEEGIDRDDYMENTALCSILAIKTLSPERTALHNYIMSNRSGELLFNLERLIYLTELIPDATTHGKFKYSIGDKETEVTLEKSNTYSLTLTPDELDNFKIVKVEGDIAVAERYIGPVTDLNGKSSDKISIKRRYELIDNETSEFNQSDYIKIILTPEFSEGAADGLYEVTDVLPAGFRYIYRPEGFEMEYRYPSSVDSQRITFDYYYSKSDKDDINKPVLYYARAVFPGKYTADNCIMRQYDTMETAFDERKTINIIR